MGNQHASCFAGVFTVFDGTPLELVGKYVANYRRADLPFGVTYKELAQIIQKTHDFTQPLAQVFDNGAASVNILDFLSGMAFCSKALVGEKINFIFDLYDFDEPRGKLSFDELVVVLISVINGVTRMTGKGVCPSNEFLESVVKTTYTNLNKEWYHYLSLAEFSGFVSSFLGVTASDDVVSLSTFFRQFRCVEYSHVDPLKAFFGRGEPDVSAAPIPRRFPTFPSTANSLLKRHLTPAVYEALKEKETPEGVSLYDVIKVGVQAPICKLGVIALDPESYTVFAPLFDPIIEAYHAGYRLASGHPRDLDPSHLGEAAADPDPESEYVESTRIRVARNLRGFPLPGRLSTGQRKDVERSVVAALSSLKGDLAGKYYPLEDMDDEMRVALEKEHFLFRKETGYFAFGGIYRDWPEGRGIYFNSSRTFLVWVNEEDELRIISMQPGGDIGAVFGRLSRAITALEAKLDFLFDDQRGYMASCPSNLGTGMRASVYIRLPLASNSPQLKAICDELYLQARGADGEHSEVGEGIVDISPLKRLGVSEVECARALHTGVTRLIALEKELYARAHPVVVAVEGEAEEKEGGDEEDEEED